MPADIIFSEQSEAEDYSVRLPVSKNDFIEFLGNLLGKPQEISQEMSGVFQVQRQDIDHLHHLLLHRVIEQNEGKLIQFQAKISYTNGRSVTISSYEEFSLYNETLKLNTKIINLSWVFMITFPTKGSPERQEVQIRFVTGKESDDFGIDISDIAKGELLINTSKINLSIMHTARSWGQDIEFLLQDPLKQILKDGKQRKSIYEHIWNYSSFFISPIIFTGLIGIITAVFIKLSRYMFGPESTSINSTSVIESFYNFSWLVPIVISATYSIPIIGIAIFFVVFWSDWGKFRKRSFIVFTNEDRKRVEDYNEKQNKKNISRVIAIAGSLALGVIGNIIAYYAIEAIIK